MPEFLFRPWPWYIAGPLIGLFAPLLLWLGNRLFGVSSNFRHLCAAIYPPVNSGGRPGVLDHLQMYGFDVYKFARVVRHGQAERAEYAGAEGRVLRPKARTTRTGWSPLAAAPMSAGSSRWAIGYQRSAIGVTARTGW